MPTSPAWNDAFVIVRTPGLDVIGALDGVTVPIGAVEGVGLSAEVEGLDSGEFDACCWSAAHPVETSRAAKITK